MRFNSSKIILVLGALGCFVASAANATHGSCSVGGSCDSWTDSHVYNLEADFNNGTSGIDINVDGVNVNVSISAWSDTGDYHDTDSYCSSWRYFRCVEYTPKEGSYWYDGRDTSVQSATFAGPWGGGYGMYSGDANDSHSIDNFIDNPQNDWQATDYDMVLLTFSHEVSLTGATFSWVGSNDVSSQQVTVAGLTDTGEDLVRSGSASWNDVSGSVADSMKNSFQIGQSGAYYSDFTFTGTSQYWLVGAYNSAFGYVSGFSKRDDGFKLASIGFSKPGDPQDTPEPVNAPSSFALLLLAGGFAAWRRKQRN